MKDNKRSEKVVSKLNFIASIIGIIATVIELIKALLK